MGQEIGVTPLQILTAMSAIANGGMIVQPHVVSELRKGADVLPPTDPPPAPRRVIQATTAATMRQMLEGVVLKGGTGPLARLDGYTAGGKTGTAQKFDPATGRYSTSQYVASRSPCWCNWIRRRGRTKAVKWPRRCSIVWPSRCLNI
jgi:cell division protein FtsI (penicillin-binding protein 3)